MASLNLIGGPGYPVTYDVGSDGGGESSIARSYPGLFPSVGAQDSEKRLKLIQSVKKFFNHVELRNLSQQDVDDFHHRLRALNDNELQKLKNILTLKAGGRQFSRRDLLSNVLSPLPTRCSVALREFTMIPKEVSGIIEGYFMPDILGFLVRHPVLMRDLQRQYESQRFPLNVIAPVSDLIIEMSDVDLLLFINFFNEVCVHHYMGHESEILEKIEKLMVCLATNDAFLSKARYTVERRNCYSDSARRSYYDDSKQRILSKFLSLQAECS